MANILDEQERKRKELAAQGIRTRGVAGAKGGPAEMTYKPLEQRTGAEAKALGVSPQMQGQIAQEQGLIPPAALPSPAVTPSQAPAPQARGISPQAQGVTPQAQAANQQLETARAGMGANRARSNTRLTDMVKQVDPRIREDANLRREWRMMTPQQRKEHIGLKKLEMDARGAEDAVAGATWEDIDKMSRSFADATGTAMDSYGNSFYTPEQQMFIREKRRNIDRAASEMFSQADRSAWITPQDVYQAIASLPEVQQAGPFGLAYAFDIMRRYATPQLRAQMEAEDRNQGLFTEWFNSKTEAEIAEMQQASGMRMTAEGSKDFAAELYLNRDKDIGAGSIYQQFLSESPQVFTAIDGRVQVDPAQEGRFKQAQAQRKAKSDANAKEEELRALEAYEDKRYAAIQQMNPERAAMMIKNPITRKYEDLKEFSQKAQQDMDLKTKREIQQAIPAMRQEVRTLRQLSKAYGRYLTEDGPERFEADLQKSRQKVYEDTMNKKKETADEIQAADLAEEAASEYEASVRAEYDLIALYGDMASVEDHIARTEELIANHRGAW